MKETRFFFVPNAANETEMPMDEAMHALRVLRLKSGDEMFLMDGDGTFYRAEVTIAATKHCMYEIKEALPQQKGWTGYIHLAMAPTKMMDRVEWLVEKATEIGFDEMSFLNCKFSERKSMRTVRLDKIAVAAVKQSRKPWKPQLNSFINFKEFVSDLQNMPKDEKVTILVGPEGDFSFDEVQLAISKGYQSITLGNSRLRTETAGLLAVTMAQLALRKE